MILHYERLSLPESVLKKYGFKKWRGRFRSYTHIRQINSKHYLLYDDFGIMTWGKKASDRGRIIPVLVIPRPIREEKHLKELIKRINKLTKKYA